MDAPAPSDARPLRILVVSNLYPSPAHPAFGTFVAARVAELRRAGHEVDVAAILDDRVHQRVARKYLALTANAVQATLRARIRRQPHDVVEAHIAFPTGLVAWLAARIGGARLVLFCHGSDVVRLPWAGSRRAAAARWLFARADLVIANSPYIADIAATRLGPLRRPVAVISPGISLPDPDAPPSAAGDGREPGSVLFVGRLAPGKGAEVLLAAIERPWAAPGTDPVVTIVGDGSLRPELEARARDAGLAGSVRFAGSLAPDRLAGLYRTTMAVVVPSTEPEGLNLVALEAMAHGAIVVATTVGGLAGTMRDGENGLTVEADDPDALAHAIGLALALAGTPDGDRLRAAGLVTAAAHDRRAAVAASVRCYRDLVRA